MKIKIAEAKFSVGPTIGQVVRTFLSHRQADLKGLEMEYDTDAQLLYVRWNDEKLFVGLTNIAWFKILETKEVEAGPVSKETRKASA